MKKILSMLVALAAVFSMLMAVSAAGATYYVATDGDDANAGTAAAPFATLEKAVSAAEGQNAIINVKGGTYLVTKELKLTEKNSNLVIKAADGEEVIFTGAFSLPLSDFKVVSGDEKDRIIDKKAQEKVVCIDTDAAGVTVLGELALFDHGFDIYPGAPALYAGDKSMTLARYPNDDYMLVEKVIAPGKKMFDYYPEKNWPTIDEVTDDMQFKITFNDKRYEKWAKADDIWAFGYWMHDWAGGNMGVSIDAESGVLTSKYPSAMQVAEKRRFYVYNLLEEIDVPGEWYLDRGTKKLYVYPTEDFKSLKNLDFITFNESFIEAKGAKNVTVYGIKFDKSVGFGITGENLESFVVDSCEFSNISGIAMKLEKSTRSGIRNSYIHDMGAHGVSIEGGDRETLTPGENFVDNNRFEHFGRIKTTYTSAASVSGCGNSITHNVISDGPHMAIGFSGNDHVVEYNEVYNVCKDTNDAGALYVGRDWSSRGNVIRYNYFHDMELLDNLNTGMKIYAVYLDDCFSSAEVYGNVFYRVSAAALFGGGRNNSFVNNVMIDCGESITYDARGTTWMNCGEGSEIRVRLQESPYEKWGDKYPNLQGMLKDDPEVPKYSTVKDNISYRTPAHAVDPLVSQYGEVKADVETAKNDIFESYRDKDFTLKMDKVAKLVADFPEIPFKKIGQYEAEKPVFDVSGMSADAKAISDKSIVLAIGSPKASVFGSVQPIDSQNTSVAPIIKSNRTLVPVRFISEGFELEVKWDGATKTVTIGDNISLTIGKPEIIVDGKAVALDAAPQIIENRTMLPLRAISESLGKKVTWDGKGLIVIGDEEYKPEAAVVDELIASIK